MHNNDRQSRTISPANRPAVLYNRTFTKMQTSLHKNIAVLIFVLQCTCFFSSVVVIESFTYPRRQRQKSESLTKLANNSPNKKGNFHLIRRKKSSSTSSTLLATGTSTSISDDNHGEESSTSTTATIMKRKINREFLSIAFPAFLQQAAVPVADLIDAAFLRKLDPSALGGMGVARASQAAVSKLYNTPLSKTTISLIASKYGIAQNENATDDEKKELSVAVSTGLLLALTVGLIQLFVFSTMSKPILGLMGVTDTSDMIQSATSYMRARAIGLPASTLWLISNGVFRGLGDTTTPLLCSGLLNVISLLLNPLFILRFQWGASGAALSTAVAQYCALIPLLWTLQKRVPLTLVGGEEKSLPSLLLDSLKQYLEAGVYLLGRTVARVAAFTYCSRQSALLGSVAASAYSITFQLGFQITLVCESIAVAVQTLLSREMAKNTSRPTKIQTTIISHIVRQSILMGLVSTGLISMLTYVFRTNIISMLSKNEGIQQVVLQAIPPFLLTQVVKGIAFPVNGIVMGSMDWKFSMLTMFFANAICFGTLRYPLLESVSVVSSGSSSVGRIWTAWTTFMASQAVFGLVRYATKTGAWKRSHAKESSIC